MKIIKRSGSMIQEAYRLGGTCYKCFPPSINTVDEAKEFAEIVDAAKFLIENPTWGIRMNPGSSIIYNDVEIHR